jgi:hypothetical protein
MAVAILIAAAAGGEAQSVNLIENELDAMRESFFRLGPFYATPGLRLTTGYDSNALSTPVPQSDIMALFGPGIRLALPLGNVAFFDVYQEVDYVYYREQVELRRFFDVTEVGAGFGGRRFLVRVDDQFRDETARPTSEFDEPVRQRSNELSSSLSLALGWRQTLELAFRQSRYDILEGQDDPLVRARLNRVQDSFGLDFTRNVTAKTRTVAEGFFERFDFDDPTRDGDSYGARFGFEFSPGEGDPLSANSLVNLTGPFLNGRLLLGFRNVDPYDPERVDYTGLIGSIDVTFGFGEGQRLRALYARDIVPSIFEDNWYFVENRYGASFTYQMTPRLSMTPGFAYGRNRYPLPQETPSGPEEIRDEHTTFRFAFDVRVTDRWTMGLALDYLDRNSNVFFFDKDRLLAGFTMSLTP